MVTPESTTANNVATERVLGVSFFNSGVAEAVDYLQRVGGYMVAPVSPALMKLNYDQEYRNALQKTDLAVADSGLLVLLWKLATGRHLQKISGLSYLKCLLERDGVVDATFWVVSSKIAKERTLDWLQNKSPAPKSERVYVVTQSAGSPEHYNLLEEIELQRPGQVVLAIAGGLQEKLALYLRDYLRYRPTIHCVGAALGFLTGDEKPIPEWADRFFLGWMVRLLSQPRMLVPRLWIIFQLAAMVFRFRSELPPLRAHWADV